MWDVLIQNVLDNLTPLALVGISLLLTWRISDKLYKSNDTSSKNMVEMFQQSQKSIETLTSDMSKLMSLLQKSEVEEQRFNRILGMYEQAMTKITTTQERLATTLEQTAKESDKSSQRVIEALNLLAEKQSDSDKNFNALKLDIYKILLSKEVKKD